MRAEGRRRKEGRKEGEEERRSPWGVLLGVVAPPVGGYARVTYAGAERSQMTGNDPKITALRAAMISPSPLSLQ